MSSVGKVPIVELARELVPFILSIVAVLILITYVPAFVTWLPRLFFN
jgi:TRAP-type C4-dicarboxylate transport system permease large subunit